MAYEVKLHVGQYEHDAEAWMDVRLTDMGAVVSVCDIDLNIRSTFVIDQGRKVFSEVQPLIADPIKDSSGE